MAAFNEFEQRVDCGDSLLAASSTTGAPRNDTYVRIYIYVYIRFLRRQRHSYFTYRDKVDLYFCENVHLIFTFVKMSTQPVDIFTKVKINFIASGTTCVPHDDSISEKPAPLL